MDPRPILQYLLRQLHVRNTSEIIVLREIIGQMAGIQQLSNVTSYQVEGLGGGISLQSSVFEVIDDKREESQQSGKQLVDSLCNLDIVCEMFIAICQMHGSFIHTIPDDLAHQKFLAYRYDDLTHILYQYIEMINHFMEPEQFRQTVIPIAELCMSYGVKPSWAFGLWRANLGEEIRKFDQSKLKDSTPSTDQQNEDIEMADANEKSPEQNDNEVSVPCENQKQYPRGTSNR